MKPIYSLEALQSEIENEPLAVVYFSSETCSVCKTLKPKVAELLNARFPGVSLFYVDIEKSPVISGQYRVFSIPTIDVYVQGKEHARFSRNLTLFDFEHALSKPYEMLYS
jgi:thioredoxin-like negative regulator of GroEL